MRRENFSNIEASRGVQKSLEKRREGFGKIKRTEETCLPSIRYGLEKGTAGRWW